ncbi:MAG: CvpA family protein [Candidatus Omnitrophica bacterium]|nr:CvpA family protein [Candidatus Omnitrophota bacterium]
MGYVGFKLGLAPELLKLAGVLVGFFVSFGLFHGIGGFIGKWTFLSEEWAKALVMVSLILVGYFAVTRGLRLLEKLVQVSFQPKLAQIGGLAVGLIRAGFVTSVILVICSQLPSEYLSASIEQHSLTGHAMVRVAPAVYSAATPWVHHIWSGFRAPAS